MMLALVRMNRRSRQTGFTLIELMITIAIVAILAAIVIPSYNAQVRKTRRSDAINTLMQIAQELERCRSDTNSYTVASGCQNYNVDPDDNALPRLSQQQYYRITAVQNAADYTLTANPVANGVQDDDNQCDQFTLTQTGGRAVEDADGNDTTTNCWQQ